jgi:hypothetical protein
MREEHQLGLVLIMTLLVPAIGMLVFAIVYAYGG